MNQAEIAKDAHIVGINDSTIDKLLEPLLTQEDRVATEVVRVPV